MEKWGTLSWNEDSKISMLAPELVNEQCHVIGSICVVILPANTADKESSQIQSLVVTALRA